jgi:hypothetical protein
MEFLSQVVKLGWNMVAKFTYTNHKCKRLFVENKMIESNKT